MPNEPDNVQSATLEILKWIQADISKLGERVERLENLVRKQGRDSAAMLIIMRSTVGTYEERLQIIE